MRAVTTRRGQATTEYVLLIAFLVVALLVAAYAFLPGFSQGMDGLERDAGGLIASGTESGRGDKR